MSKEFSKKVFTWLQQINRSSHLAVDVRVALELSRHFHESDQGGRAFPGYKTIGEPIRLSERTIIRAIDRLKAKGDLYVIPGKPGRGHPNQYWMVLKEAPAEQPKTCTRAQVLTAARKPAPRAAKTCTQQQENHKTLSGECYAFPLIAGERDRTACDVDPPSGGGPRLAPVPAQEDSSSEPIERLPTPTQEATAAFRELRALWQRGHAADDTPKAQAIARQAFAKALGEVAPEEILDAARIWIAAADAPRFLPALPQWLAAEGWAKPPPTKRATASRKSRSNGYGAKPDMFKIALEAGGYREDADGKMFWPGDGGEGDDDAPLGTMMWGGGQ